MSNTSVNRLPVERFFELPIGEERANLFADDGIKEIATLGPLVWRGKDALLANTENNIVMFPNWQWSNVEIWETHDPEWFWVEADGAGEKVPTPGADPLRTGSHYIFNFRVVDGKIALMREFVIKVQPLAW